MIKRRKYKDRKYATAEDIAEAVRLCHQGLSLTEIAERLYLSHTQIGIFCYGIIEPFTEEQKKVNMDIYKMFKSGIPKEEICKKYNITITTAKKYRLAGDRLVNNPEIFEKPDAMNQLSISDVTPEMVDEQIEKKDKIIERIKILIIDALTDDRFELASLLIQAAVQVHKKEDGR